MDSALKTLHDKSYDKRKVAALDVEKLVRDALQARDHAKIALVVHSLNELARSTVANARSGALMGLAGVSIALGSANVARHLAAIVPPVLASFTDIDSKVRYYACESMYNISKVAKGEILVYFNELFDAMAKLYADSEIPVKNGAELLDRLIKDIVSDQAAKYVSSIPASAPDNPTGLGISRPGSSTETDIQQTQAKTAFSLTRFIPLLKERINAVNPETRMYLVSWITVLDSVPELELITYLPDFLEGLIWFLDDPTDEIRIVTQNCLAELLKETHDIADTQAARSQRWRDRMDRIAAQTEKLSHDQSGESNVHSDLKSTSEGSPNISHDTLPSSPGQTSISIPEADEQSPIHRQDSPTPYQDDDGEGLGTWEPGQGVLVRHAEIVEILLRQMMVGPETAREVQAVCLRWIADFLQFAQPVILSFVPRLIPLVISALAHHVPSLRQAAHNLNVSLFHVISELPSPPTDPTLAQSTSSIDEEPPRVQSPPTSLAASRDRSLPGQTTPQTSVPFPSSLPNSSKIPVLVSSADKRAASPTDQVEDPFDYQATVGALCTLLGVEEEESRLAALHWLSMLHSKSPKGILTLEDGTFPALLKTLSDPSEEVIKSDLQLLAQISSASDPEYFTSFMVNLVRLFSTDKPLLELRGRTIIGQLCLSLNTERIFRSFADILEKEEDLEFASLLVQNLVLFLITLPELADFRRRLKNLDTKDGQALFVNLYRSFSHSAVATLTLCFLAQAYEQASNLLQIFAELEMTVNLLIQLDKLVQLLESTVFTSLRLQLLETERYPFLLKALYGLLMLLPQSTAFVTLRNRLNSVSSFGHLQAIPRAPACVYSDTMHITQFYSQFSGSAAAAAARSVIRKQDEIKWPDLLSSFRTLQFRHERARTRRHAMQAGGANAFDFEASPPRANSTQYDSASLMNMASNRPASNRRTAASRHSTVRETLPANARTAPKVTGRSSSVATSSLRPTSPPSTGNSATGANVQRRMVSSAAPKKV